MKKFSEQKLAFWKNFWKNFLKKRSKNWKIYGHLNKNRPKKKVEKWRAQKKVGFLGLKWHKNWKRSVDFLKVKNFIPINHLVQKSFEKSEKNAKKSWLFRLEMTQKWPKNEVDFLKVKNFIPINHPFQKSFEKSQKTQKSWLFRLEMTKTWKFLGQKTEKNPKKSEKKLAF